MAFDKRDSGALFVGVAVGVLPWLVDKAGVAMTPQLVYGGIGASIAFFLVGIWMLLSPQTRIVSFKRTLELTPPLLKEATAYCQTMIAIHGHDDPIIFDDVKSGRSIERDCSRCGKPRFQKGGVQL